MFQEYFICSSSKPMLAKKKIIKYVLCKDHKFKNEIKIKKAKLTIKYSKKFHNSQSI